MDSDHHFLSGLGGGTRTPNNHPSKGRNLTNGSHLDMARPCNSCVTGFRRECMPKPYLMTGGALSIELRDALRPHDGTRTRISPFADPTGLEPVPDRLTADRSNH